jgi:hypothetical protein
MRAFLLLVLGAGLVWFVWRGLGSSAPAEVAATEAAPGAMIAVSEPEPTPAAAEVGSPPTVTRRADSAPVAEANTVSETPPAPMISTEPSPAATAPSTAPDQAVSTPDRESLGSELPAATRLLQDPAQLDAWIRDHGTELSAARREYAIGLVCAFSGRGGDADAALDRAERSGGTPALERDLLRRIAAGTVVAGPISGSSPLARAAEMKALERSALAAQREGRAQEAAVAFSRLLLGEIASPWPADPIRLAEWSYHLHEVQRKHRWNRRGHWPFREVVVQPGDSLIAIRKRAVAADPNLLVCTGQIARVNQLEGETIHPGEKLRIPLDPVRVLVDLDAHWAFYLTGEEVAAAWPVGVGKESSATRVGNFVVGELTRQPMWFPQGRKPVPYGDPENPLGTRWIAWNDAEGRSTGLGFHGTNEPQSIGGDASLGCIRMRTPDVEDLYEILPRGARITVLP